MDSGFYAACAGLRARTQTLDLIANNVANLDTVGYRGEQPSFSSLLMNAVGGQSGLLVQAINNFNVLESSHVDVSPGNLVRTGNSFDLAIEGSGFFAVQGNSGTVYTRDGNFQLSSKGQLVTSRGELVLGEQGGAIVLPNAPLTISSNGTISVEGAIASRIKLVDLDPSSVHPLGNGRYAASGSVRPAASSYVRQGMLESSNVNAVSAVTDLISVQRHAEMLERAMTLFHSNLNHIAASDLPHI